MAAIAHVRGRLTLTIAGAEAVDLGHIDIPIEVAPGINQTTGHLLLRATPNMREVRETLGAIFGQNEATS